MIKTVLLTGGAGYIGSHTLLELSKSEAIDKLIVVDNLSSGSKLVVDKIREVSKKDIELCVGDILDKNFLNQVFDQYKIDAVLHFAAVISVGESMFEPIKYYKVNTTGTLNLLEVMQEHGVDKIIFSSTAAVYGTPKNTEVKETDAEAPESVYGDTKLIGEKMIKSLVSEQLDKTKRINSVIFRYFNAAGCDADYIIGPMHISATHLIPNVVTAALNGTKLKIFGNDYKTADGTCIRDYIHVSDLATAHVKALHFLETFEGTETFNLGTGRGSSNLEILNYTKKIHDGELEWEWAPRRAGDAAAMYTNPSKAENLLGWKARYTVQDSILHAYNWQKIHYKNFIE